MRKSDKYVEENGMESQLCIIFKVKLKFVGVLPTGRYSRPGSYRFIHNTKVCSRYNRYFWQYGTLYSMDLLQIF